MGSGAGGLTGAWGYWLPLVPAGMRRVDYGKSTGLLGWVLVDDGVQVKVDPPTIYTVNIPFYGIVMMMPLVPRSRLWGLVRRRTMGAWFRVL